MLDLLPAQPELLFYGGLAICAATVLIAVVTMVILRISKSRLNKQLDKEFGRKGR